MGSEWFEMLQKISSLPKSSWTKVQPHIKTRQVPKGEFYIRDGDLPDEVGFLLKGLLRKFYISHDGKEHTKGFTEPRQLVAPFVALLTGTKAPFHVQALENSTLLTVKHTVFRSLMTQDPAWERTGRLIAERTLVDREKREAELLMLSATDRYEAFRRDFPSLCERIPQYLIASYLGMTPVALKLRTRGFFMAASLSPPQTPYEEPTPTPCAYQILVNTTECPSETSPRRMQASLPREPW